MLHRLTIGHLDPAAVQRRQTVPTKALEMDVVHRLLDELGEKDAEGNVTLGGCKVKFHNAAVSCLWMGGKTNRVAEEFALRMNRETGCLLADVDCGRMIDPGKLAGLNISDRLEERRKSLADEAKGAKGATHGSLVPESG